MMDRKEHCCTCGHGLAMLNQYKKNEVSNRIIKVGFKMV
jgi:hypothetical protein